MQIQKKIQVTIDPIEVVLDIARGLNDAQRNALASVILNIDSPNVEDYLDDLVEKMRKVEVRQRTRFRGSYARNSNDDSRRPDANHHMNSNNSGARGAGQRVDVAGRERVFGLDQLNRGLIRKICDELPIKGASAGQKDEADSMIRNELIKWFNAMTSANFTRNDFEDLINDLMLGVSQVRNRKYIPDDEVVTIEEYLRLFKAIEEWIASWVNILAGYIQRDSYPRATDWINGMLEILNTLKWKVPSTSVLPKSANIESQLTWTLSNFDDRNFVEACILHRMLYGPVCDFATYAQYNGESARKEYSNWQVSGTDPMVYVLGQGGNFVYVVRSETPGIYVVEDIESTYDKMGNVQEIGLTGLRIRANKPNIMFGAKTLEEAKAFANNYQ